MSQRLTQQQQDLRMYAQEKLYNLIRDVMQAHHIAGEPLSVSRAMLGAMFMRMSATLAQHGNLSRESWDKYCAECWQKAAEAKEEVPE